MCFADVLHIDTCVCVNGRGWLRSSQLKRNQLAIDRSHVFNEPHSENMNENEQLQLIITSFNNSLDLNSLKCGNSGPAGSLHEAELQLIGARKKLHMCVL